jgi:hypothetical protein
MLCMSPANKTAMKKLIVMCPEQGSNIMDASRWTGRSRTLDCSPRFRQRYQSHDRRFGQQSIFKTSGTDDESKRYEDIKHQSALESKNPPLSTVSVNHYQIHAWEMHGTEPRKEPHELDQILAKTTL